MSELILPHDTKILLFDCLCKIDGSQEEAAITTAIDNVCKEFIGDQSDKPLYDVRKLVRDAMDLPWVAVLRARGSVLLKMIRDYRDQYMGEAPVELAESPSEAPEPKAPVKPRKSRKKDPVIETDPLASTKEEEPKEEEPLKKTPVRKVIGKEVDPGHELGTYDSILGALGRLEKEQAAQGKRLGALETLMKEIHSDLGNQSKESNEEICRLIRSFWDQQWKIFQDPNYVPTKVL